MRIKGVRSNQRLQRKESVRRGSSRCILSINNPHNTTFLYIMYLTFIRTNTSSSSSMHSPIPSLFLLLLFCFFFLCFAHATDGLHDGHPCRHEKCSHGPPVMFPFWLERAECGYPGPGFQLFCDKDKRTALWLSNTTQRSLVVKSINYDSQSVLLHDPTRCLPLWIANLSLLGFSASSHSSLYPYPYNYTLFKCPPPERTGLTEMGCLSQPGSDKVYAVESNSKVGDSPLVYCERNGSLNMLPDWIENIIAEARFDWKVPDCRSCRNNGSSCGLNGSNIRCFPPPRGHPGIVLIALG